MFLSSCHLTFVCQIGIDCFHSFVNVQQVLLHIIKVLEQNTDCEAWMLVCQMNSDQLTLVLCQKHRG